MSSEPLLCPLCFTLYRDEKRCSPRILPCGHTFCSGCIKRSSTFRCPRCNQLHDISKLPAPKNFAVANLAQTFLQNVGKDKQLATCQNCKERPAFFRCGACSADLCTRCDALIHSLNVFSQHSRSRIPSILSCAAAGGQPLNTLTQTPLEELAAFCASLPDAGSGADNEIAASICISGAATMTELSTKCRDWLQSENCRALTHGNEAVLASLRASFDTLCAAFAARSATLKLTLEALQQRAVSRCDEQCAEIRAASKLAPNPSLAPAEKALVDGAMSALPLCPETVRVSQSDADSAVKSIEDNSIGVANVLRCHNPIGCTILANDAGSGRVTLLFSREVFPAAGIDADNREAVAKALGAADSAASADELAYEVQRKKLGEPDSQYLTVYRSSAPSCMVEAKPPGVYCFRARRVNAFRAGPWGPVVFWLCNDTGLGQQM